MENILEEKMLFYSIYVSVAPATKMFIFFYHWSLSANARNTKYNCIVKFYVLSLNVCTYKISLSFYSTFDFQQQVLNHISCKLKATGFKKSTPRFYAKIPKDMEENTSSSQFIWCLKEMNVSVDLIKLLFLLQVNLFSNEIHFFKIQILKMLFMHSKISSARVH